MQISLGKQTQPGNLFCNIKKWKKNIFHNYKFLLTVIKWVCDINELKFHKLKLKQWWQNVNNKIYISNVDK